MHIMLQIIKNRLKKASSILAAGVLLFSQAAVVPTVGAASAWPTTDPNKISICHAASAINNPYQDNTVDKSAVDGLGQNDHSHHDDPVLNSSMQQGDDWGDIIPPNEYDADGLNWTAEGQAIWNNMCVTKGSIKVIKDAQPDSTDDFDFTIKQGATLVEDFELEDDGDNSDGELNSETVDELPAGTYVITEIPEQSGWVVDGISCTGASYTADPANKQATITVGIAQNAVCTFVNKKQGSITLVKNVVNNNGGTAAANDFGLSIGGTSVNSGQTLTLNPGAYALNELGLNGYAFTSLTGTDCPTQLGGTVNLGSGQHITCTITNDDIAPTMTVVKNVINDNGGTLLPANFTMQVNGTNVSVPSFPGDSAGTTVTLNAGSYTVTEIHLPGYAPSYTADCTGTIALGENKTCTITNDDMSAVLTLIKRVVNNNGGILTTVDFPL